LGEQAYQVLQQVQGDSKQIPIQKMKQFAMIHCCSHQVFVQQVQHHPQHLLAVVLPAIKVVGCIVISRERQGG